MKRRQMLPLIALTLVAISAAVLLTARVRVVSGTLLDENRQPVAGDSRFSLALAAEVIPLCLGNQYIAALTKTKVGLT